MDKEARLSSARKKLKKFQRKRESESPSGRVNKISNFDRKSTNSQKHDSSIASNASTPPHFSSAESTPQRRASPLPHSTGSSAESILQVSSTLNGIIAEVENLTENGTYFNAGVDKAVSEYSNSSDISSTTDETIKNLQKRNVELMERVGAVEVEREQLKAQCSQITKQIFDVEKKNTESEAAHAQLNAQKQTIEILVSEKQDLHRQLSDVKLKAQSSSAEQMVLQETLQSYKKQIGIYEAEITEKRKLISTMESTIVPLQADYEHFQEESSRLGQALEREKLQTSELTMKLTMRETELNQLLESHADMQEKLNMAEVLLQQYSTRKDDISDTARLEAENRHLTHELQNSQLAVEKLADERDHIIKQHADSQKDWEYHIQQLQDETRTLQDALLRSKQETESLLATSSPAIPSENKEPAEAVVVNTSDSFCQTDNALQEAIASLSNNNRHLSLLLQEKELQIEKLGNELQDARSIIQDHEFLLESSRNDKVTISRALTQNKQLKEQLEEIQDTFISISNDKMDLATQLSTLESINKNLSERLKEITDAFNIAKQDLESQKGKILALQESNFHIKPEAPSPVDEAQIETSFISEPEIILNGIVENSQDDQPDVHEVSPPDQTDIPLEAVNISCNDSSEPVHTDPKMMDMLQQKFTSVMRERADLMNRVEVLEHANTQLQNECDTIGEYITLYHNQRQLLKQRHHEKDLYISNIIQEREEMRGKVEQLQTLVGTVLKSNAQSTPSMLQNHSGEIDCNGFMSNESDTCTPQPDLVPKTNSSEEPIPSTAPHVRDAKHIRNGADDLAAQQIFNLLQQMQKPTDPPSPTSSRPSGFCMRYIGPYTAI